MNDEIELTGKIRSNVPYKIDTEKLPKTSSAFGNLQFSDFFCLLFSLAVVIFFTILEQQLDKGIYIK